MNRSLFRITIVVVLLSMTLFVVGQQQDSTNDKEGLDSISFFLGNKVANQIREMRKISEISNILTKKPIIRKISPPRSDAFMRKIRESYLRNQAKPLRVINSFLLSNQKFVIKPGMLSPPRSDEFMRRIRANQMKPLKVNNDFWNSNFKVKQGMRSPSRSDNFMRKLRENRAQIYTTNPAVIRSGMAANIPSRAAFKPTRGGRR